MRIKEWTKRVLCFVLGAVAAGLLIVASTSQAEPRDALEQRVASLEQRVAAIEERHKAEDKAAQEEAKRERAERMRRDRQ